MKFAKQAKKTIEATAHDVQQILLVLSRIETSLPHLYFHPWRASINATETQGRVIRKPNYEVEVRLDFSDGLRLSTICQRYSGQVSREDHQFLVCLSKEALTILESQTDSPLPLFEFGSLAVAESIQKSANLDGDVHPTLTFIRSLVHETYENQRLSYGIVISKKGGGLEEFAGAFDNKRIKRLTDGFSTALVLDQWQRINGYVSLDTPRDEAKRLTQRPWWASALAEKAKELNGVGVALVRSGDLIVLHHGKLVFSQRAGRWQVWNHKANLDRLRSAWNARGNRQNIDQVLGCLYHVALDLSFRRSGGLLVVVNSSESFRQLIMSRTDILGSTSNRRGAGERALDQILSRRTVQNTDRRVLADMASLDGALIVDRTGNILAYGAMTRPAVGTEQGARAKAALAASRKGIALKISSDGNISFYAVGKKFLNL